MGNAVKFPVSLTKVKKLNAQMESAASALEVLLKMPIEEDQAEALSFLECLTLGYLESMAVDLEKAAKNSNLEVAELVQLSTDALGILTECCEEAEAEQD